MRLSFRGIYFPQMGILSWGKVLKDNRQTIFQLVKETWLTVRKKGTPQRTNSHPQRAIKSSNSNDQAPSSVESFAEDNAMPAVEEAFTMQAKAR